MASKFQHVLILTGNHEYYTYEMNEVHSQLDQLCKQHPNVHFLNKNGIEFDDIAPNIRFIGATLWTFYEEELALHTWPINDFKQISLQTEAEEEKDSEKTTRRFTVEDCNALFLEHSQFIRDEISEAKSNGKRLVILTHHAPTGYKSILEEENSAPVMRRLNFTPLEELLTFPVLAWCFGHTHRCTHFVVRTLMEDESEEWFCQVAANQQGYITRTPVPKDYSQSKVIHLGSDGGLPDELRSIVVSREEVVEECRLRDEACRKTWRDNMRELMKPAWPESDREQVKDKCQIL